MSTPYRAFLASTRKAATLDELRGNLKEVSELCLHFAKPVLALLAAHPDQIELVTSPTYSPQRNPVERFWKHARRKVTHNAVFQTTDRFLEAVTMSFQDLTARPDSVRSVAG